MAQLQRFAHRGYAGIAPENTIAAARCAHRHDADWIEIDVIPTGDGDVVVFHDNRLDGVAGSRGITDKTGLVWETPTADVTTAEVLESEESIPTLASLCEAVPQNIGLNVELKHCGTPTLRTEEALDPATRDTRKEQWQPFVADVVETLDRFGGTVLFSSFAEGALAALRDDAPTAALAPIVRNDVTVALELADRYDATAIHPSLTALGIGTINPAEASPSSAPVDRVHNNGYSVNVWTVRTWYQAHQAQRLGVDGIIADYPQLLSWR